MTCFFQLEKKYIFRQEESRSVEQATYLIKVSISTVKLEKKLNAEKGKAECINPVVILLTLA